MRVKAEQLSSQIQNKLPLISVVYGDEALLVEEAADQIRLQAKKQGIAERQVWHADARFDWSKLRFADESLSLFASQKLVEIRLPSAAPGKEGGEFLRQFAEQPAPDTNLLLITGKLSAQQQKTKWFTALENAGISVPIWPVSLEMLPRWIQQRMRQKGLQASPVVANMLAERTEGNLFAAAQEIDKLVLLSSDGQVDEQLLIESVADSARFEAFSLMDVVYAGQAAKIPRMLRMLQAEGNDVLAVFSAVSWSLHRMIDMADQIENGVQPAQVFASQKPPVWDKARPLIQSGLRRHAAAKWRTFLPQMAAIDRAAKGGGHDNAWRMLTTLCLQVAGVPMNLQQT